MARKLRVEYPGVIYHVMNREDRSALTGRDAGDSGLDCEAIGGGERGERAHVVVSVAQRQTQK